MLHKNIFNTFYNGVELLDGNTNVTTQVDNNAAGNQSPLNPELLAGFI